jgi:hypothetical protein
MASQAGGRLMAMRMMRAGMGIMERLQAQRSLKIVLGMKILLSHSIQAIF